jgi:hypothetical protein
MHRENRDGPLDGVSSATKEERKRKRLPRSWGGEECPNPPSHHLLVFEPRDQFRYSPRGGRLPTRALKTMQWSPGVPFEGVSSTT